MEWNSISRHSVAKYSEGVFICMANMERDELWLSILFSGDTYSGALFRLAGWLPGF